MAFSPQKFRFLDFARAKREIVLRAKIPTNRFIFSPFYRNFRATAIIKMEPQGRFSQKTIKNGERCKNWLHFPFFSKKLFN